MNRGNQVILGIVVLIVIGAGIVLASRHNGTSTSSTSPSPSPASSSSTPSSTSPSSSSSDTNISLTANDNSASITNINVNNGAHVNLTFKVDEDGVYHGGLEFKSTDPAIDSGPIKPGDSKTVSFTATKSFSFTPYWYASDVKKDYMINVNVQ